MSLTIKQSREIQYPKGAPLISLGGGKCGRGGRAHRVQLPLQLMQETNSVM